MCNRGDSAHDRFAFHWSCRLRGMTVSKKERKQKACVMLALACVDGFCAACITYACVDDSVIQLRVGEKNFKTKSFLQPQTFREDCIKLCAGMCGYLI